MLIAAGLFVRTLANLQSVELGFNRENVLLLAINAREAGHKGADLLAFYGDLLKRFREIPGVRDAGFSDSSLIGAGFGLEFVSRSARRVIGGDLTETNLLAAREHSPQLGVLRFDAHRLPFAAGSFDAVYHSHLLEHLPRDHVNLHFGDHVALLMFHHARNRRDHLRPDPRAVEPEVSIILAASAILRLSLKKDESGLRDFPR
jgi:SAM-dependent methyltransferase